MTELNFYYLRGKVKLGPERYQLIIFFLSFNDSVKNSFQAAGRLKINRKIDRK